MTEDQEKPNESRITAEAHRRAKVRRAFLFTAWILVLSGVLLFGAYWHIDRRYGKPTRELSKMMSIPFTMHRALAAYYDRNAAYPRALSELPLEMLPWGDEGSSPRDLELWTYRSDGESFAMTWKSTRTPELFLAGRKGQIFYKKEEAENSPSLNP